MYIPPASFRVTPYGEVDAAALDRLRSSFDTSQILRLVERLDTCLAEQGGIAAVRNELLKLPAMALTLVEGAPLTESPVAVGTAVACRPRPDPYVRNYRIRLLPQVRDAKRSSG